MVLNKFVYKITNYIMDTNSLFNWVLNSRILLFINNGVKDTQSLGKH